jgi:hypothetical protein
LVEASSHIEVHTEQQVGTWQSLLELAVDPGDFTSDTSQTSTPTKSILKLLAVSMYIGHWITPQSKNSEASDILQQEVG